MMKLPLLQENDLVEIIAPGYGGAAAEIEAAADYVKSLGLQPHYPADIFGPDLFCSNSDQYRAGHLERALADPKIKAVWAFRGGYGTTRLIAHLQKIKRRRAAKLVIGYSDLTALHIFLNQQWQWPSLHAPVLAKIGERIDAGSREKLEEIIFGRKSEIIFENLVPLNIHANRNDIINAPVTGGNMVLVQNSLDTSWEIETKNKIIFLEDFGEKAYRIDRTLIQFEQAGIFAKAKALIFGQFIESETADKIDPTLERFSHRLKIPVLKCDKIGHGPVNWPLPLGTPASLDFSEANIKLIA